MQVSQPKINFKDIAAKAYHIQWDYKTELAYINQEFNGIRITYKENNTIHIHSLGNFSQYKYQIHTDNSGTEGSLTFYVYPRYAFIKLFSKLLDDEDKALIKSNIEEHITLISLDNHTFYKLGDTGIELNNNTLFSDSLKNYSEPIKLLKPIRKVNIALNKVKRENINKANLLLGIKGFDLTIQNFIEEYSKEFSKWDRDTFSSLENMPEAGYILYSLCESAGVNTVYYRLNQVSYVLINDIINLIKNGKCYDTRTTSYIRLR